MPNITVNIANGDKQVLEDIKKIMDHDSISKTVRFLIKFSKLLYHPDLTVGMAFKEHIKSLMLDNPMALNEIPLYDAIKSIARLEEELKENGIKV